MNMKGPNIEACFECFLIVVRVTLCSAFHTDWVESKKVIPLSVGLLSLELAGLHLVYAEIITRTCRAIG